MTDPAARASHKPASTPVAAGDAAWAALAMLVILLVILIPAVFTLRTVQQPISHVVTGNPTPHGYTISLLIYLTPIAVLAAWFVRSRPTCEHRKAAFAWTIATLVPMGFALDMVFGNLFFRFPNADATLRVFLPGWSFVTGGIVWDLPIEEFIFYLSGFVAILLVYIWCNEVWVPAYGVADYGDPSRHPPYIIQPHWLSAAYGLLAFAAAFVYKRLFAPITPDIDYRVGFPLYFAFLTGAAVLPSLLLYRSAKPFINWRAYSITLLWVLLTSLLWEATLASPFGWWHYRPEWMMGLHVKAWANLPVEAVILWIAVTLTTTIVFETITMALHLKERRWSRRGGS